MQPSPLQNKQMEPISQDSINSPSSSPKLMSNTVIVFDFDDTIFPTKKFKEINSRSNTINISNSSPNYSAQSLISKMSPMELKQFIELSWVTLNLLNVYINRYSHKNICIVSASSEGWVERALKNVHDIGYFKQIYDLLFINYKVLTFNPSPNIIKAFAVKRSYKSYDDHPCVQWKYYVFKYIFDEKYVDNIDVINTFVFIGDSIFEHLAANKLKNNVCINTKDKKKNVFIDRIKLKYKPEINDLINEHKDLYSRCGSFERYSFINKSEFDMDYVQEIEKKIINVKETKKEQNNEL